MPHLGAAVVYRVHDEHKTKTLKGEATLHGSVHHPELTEFAGIVGRVHDDGSCDILLLIPNREPKWVDRVHAGDGDHQFTPVG